MKFIYDINAPAIPDHLAEKEALKLKDQDVETSTSLVFDYARALYLEKKIPYFEININGEEIKLDPVKGCPSRWPKGFSDHIQLALFRVYKAGTGKHKKEKTNE